MSREMENSSHRDTQALTGRTPVDLTKMKSGGKDQGMDGGFSGEDLCTKTANCHMEQRLEKEDINGSGLVESIMERR